MDMQLTTTDDVIREVAAVLNDTSGSLQSALQRDLLLNALKCKRDGLDTLDLKVINRAVAEFRHASRVFKPFRNVRKVSIFGSARTPAEDPYYLMAADVGRALAQAGYMVITGAASGIMRAGLGGAGAANSFAVNIVLPAERFDPASFGEDLKLVRFRYFFVRKVFFVMEADAFVLFPGGFGTHDEAFEVLTLLQTGKAPPRPMVLVERPGDGYWRAWDGFIREQMLGRGYVAPEDLSLYRIVASPEEAVAAVQEYYSTFHSVRQVGETLVLRLERALSPAQVQLLNRDFADLAADGVIAAVGPFPEEQDEPALLAKPRLAFRNAGVRGGKLNQLITAINRMGQEPADEGATQAA